MYSDPYSPWKQQQSSAISNHYRRRRSSDSSDRKSRRKSSLVNGGNEADPQRDLREALNSVVEQSQVLGLKKEEHGGKEETGGSVADRESGPSSSSTSPIPLSVLDADMANGLLPPFDLLTSNLSPADQCHKFFEDLRPLDRILARVVRPGIAVLHLELICMLTRFRRTLLSFMKGKLVPVPFDRTQRFYNVNDYISTTVVSISPNSEELELEIDAEEAILTQQGIPAYCRDFDRTNFEDDQHICSLRDNPNLAPQLGVTINSAFSALPSLRSKHLELLPNAEQLRKEQSAKLAMIHVKKGAELTRENKCFEAIQCFNKALNVDSECADAYVGRGAACAGSRNFPAALQDLEKAIELQPAHRNANKYRLEVLHTFGRELERAGDFAEASAKFRQLLTLCPDHQSALEGVQRLSRVQQNDGELIELSDDEEEVGSKRKSNGTDGRDREKMNNPMSEEEVQRNRQKLAEMEAFIAKLKSGKK